MLQLKPDEYQNVMALLSQVPYNTVLARAVLNGEASGVVFADQSAQPSVCYILHQYGMSFLIGDITNDAFRTDLLKYILNTENQRSQEEWLQVYPDRWNGYLRDLLGSRLVEYMPNPNDDATEYWKNIAEHKIVQWTRLNFKFNSSSFSALNLELPAGFTVAKIGAGVNDIKGAVVPGKFYNSFQEFIDKGVGYGVFADNQIISAAFSSGLTATQLEIGIETAAEYRGKGLAVYACAALINYCLENGLEPVWSCRKENVSSLKLALRLGFEISMCMPYYSIPVSLT